MMLAPLSARYSQQQLVEHLMTQSKSFQFKSFHLRLLQDRLMAKKIKHQFMMPPQHRFTRLEDSRQRNTHRNLPRKSARSYNHYEIQQVAKETAQIELRLPVLAATEPKRAQGLWAQKRPEMPLDLKLMAHHEMAREM